MGTIASVLQWTCTNCNLINPTECLKCLNCGNIRRILDEETYTHDGDDKHRLSSAENCANRRSSSSSAGTTTTTTSTAINDSEQQRFSQSAAAAKAKHIDDGANCNGKQMSNGQWKLCDETSTATTTTTTLTRAANSNNRILHKTLPGYVEINSNGYNSCIFLFFLKRSELFYPSYFIHKHVVMIYHDSFEPIWLLLFNCVNGWYFDVALSGTARHGAPHNETPAHIPLQIHFLFNVLLFSPFPMRFVGSSDIWSCRWSLRLRLCLRWILCVFSPYFCRSNDLQRAPSIELTKTNRLVGYSQRYRSG